ncbi:MAG: transcriptional regulator, partial [Methanoregula sp.]
QEVPRRYPGGTQEVPRRYPGGTQEVPRRYPGGTQEVPRRYPGGTQEVIRLLKSFDGDMARRDLQVILNVKDDEHFRSAYLKPAIQQDLITMTIPEKPSSVKQKYRLTKKGQSLLTLK